ncbi:MAG TPA: hypothetical protein VIV57_21060 [Anaeromyxobacter sp.]
MRRAATAAALAVAALGACSDPPTQECPGEPVARFHFTGTQVFLNDPALAGLDPVPSTLDCDPPQPPDQPPKEPQFPDVLPPFDGLLAADPSTQSAALCRPTGIVLFGQRSGLRYSVQGSTDGAVLASCAATCSATLRLFVVGNVSQDGSGAPSGFAGVLVEEMSPVGGPGTCGACTLPCAARYALAGAP